MVRWTDPEDIAAGETFTALRDRRGGRDDECRVWPRREGFVRHGGEGSERCSGPRQHRQNSQYSKLILQAYANGAGLPRMQDIIRQRLCFVPQARYVVILNIVPFHIGDVEHVEGRKPLRGMKSDLRIDRGVRRRFRTVVLRQRRLPEMARTQRTEPARVALRG